MADADTKNRILDAAEKLFAEQGFGPVSVRQIIAAANVNIAAVHYHFGSKEALIRATLVRRLAPLNQERLELLDACERAAGKRAASIEKIIEALVAPPLRMTRDPSRGGETFMQLAGRAFSEPDEKIQAMLDEEFKEVVRRFMAALSRALPGLSARELFWRAHFGAGAMAHTLCGCALLKRFSGGICDPANTDEAIRELVAFLAAGMRAPSTARRKGRK